MSGIGGAISLGHGYIVPGSVRSALKKGLLARQSRTYHEISTSPFWFLASNHERCLATNVGVDYCERCRAVEGIVDANLTGHASLAEALSLQRDASVLHVMKHAWLEWGDEFPAKLSGHFVGALFIPHTRRLVIFRDHLGIRPIFFSATSSLVTFASEPEMIDADVPFRTDATSLVAHLSGVPHYPEQIPKSEVRRLMPGTVATFQGDAPRMQRYWSIQIGRVQAEDGIGMFRHTLKRSVKSALAQEEQAGLLLSGGLDSSAIALIASDLEKGPDSRPLRTYSLVFPDQPRLDERAFIDAVVRDRNLDPIFVTAGSEDAFVSPTMLIGEQGGPFGAIGLPRIRNLYRLAAANGTQVLLDGHGGDEVAGDGLGRIGELAKARRWLLLANVVRIAARRHGENPLEEYLRLFVRYASPWGLEGIVRALAWRSTKALYGRHVSTVPLWEKVLRKEYIDLAQDLRSDLQARMKSVGSPAEIDSRLQWLSLAAGDLQQSTELFDRCAARAGVELRFPFYDKDLVDISLSLPSSEKLNRTGVRSILRRALQDVYPVELRNRHSKIDFTPNLAKGLAEHSRVALQDLVDGNDRPLDVFIDRNALAAFVNEFLNRPKNAGGADLSLLWSVLNLSAWQDVGGEVGTS